MNLPVAARDFLSSDSLYLEARDVAGSFAKADFFLVGSYLENSLSSLVTDRPHVSRSLSFLVTRFSDASEPPSGFRRPLSPNSVVPDGAIGFYSGSLSVYCYSLTESFSTVFSFEDFFGSRAFSSECVAFNANSSTLFGSSGVDSAKTRTLSINNHVAAGREAVMDQRSLPDYFLQRASLLRYQPVMFSD